MVFWPEFCKPPPVYKNSMVCGLVKPERGWPYPIWTLTWNSDPGPATAQMTTCPLLPASTDQCRDKSYFDKLCPRYNIKTILLWNNSISILTQIHLMISKPLSFYIGKNKHIKLNIVKACYFLKSRLHCYFDDKVSCPRWWLTCKDLFGQPVPGLHTIGCRLSLPSSRAI